MNETIRKECIVCKGVFFCNTIAGKANKNKRRNIISITCSRKCARVYNRISNIFYQRYRKEIYKLKKQLKL